MNRPSMQDVISLLQSYNFSERESHVYLCILELGQAPASTIARKVSYPRETVYTILKKLIKKGIASKKNQKNIAIYSVLTPQEIHTSLLQKASLFESKLGLFAPMLNAHKLEHLRVDFYEGRSGLFDLYMDTIASTVPICAFLGNTEIDEPLNQKLKENYVPLRIKHAVPARVIVPNLPENQMYIELDNKEHLREVSVIPGDLITISMEIMLYGPDCVSFALYHPSELSGIRITSPQLYTNMLQLFECIRRLGKTKNQHPS